MEKMREHYCSDYFSSFTVVVAIFYPVSNKGGHPSKRKINRYTNLLEVLNNGWKKKRYWRSHNIFSSTWHYISEKKKKSFFRLTRDAHKSQGKKCLTFWEGLIWKAILLNCDWQFSSLQRYSVLSLPYSSQEDAEYLQRLGSWDVLLDFFK